MEAALLMSVVEAEDLRKQRKENKSEMCPDKDSF